MILTDPSWGTLLIEVGAILSGIVLAAVWLRSSIVRQRTSELAALVETRGNTITDLREEIAGLRQEVASLRGAVDALERLRSEEIAAKAAEAILPFLFTSGERESLRRLIT